MTLHISCIITSQWMWPILLRNRFPITKQFKDTEKFLHLFRIIPKPFVILLILRTV